MLELLDLDGPDVLACRATDVLTADDVRTATDAFETLLESHKVVPLYLELDEIEGLDAEALWRHLVYGLRYLGVLRRVGRVALVTDAGWLRQFVGRAGGVLPVRAVRAFGPAQRAEAQDWVRGGDVADGGHGADPDVAWAAAWFDEDWLDEDLADDRAMGLQTGEHRPPAPRFGHTVHRTHVLLRRVAEGLGVSGSAPAYHALRSVLHALRDRLPDAEAADLAAQLPTLVRGVFYEGYRPARHAALADREAFLEAVGAGLRSDAPFSVGDAVRAVGDALAASVSEGEWGQVLGVLPHDLRSLFEAPVGA